MLTLLQQDAAEADIDVRRQRLDERLRRLQRLYRDRQLDDGEYDAQRRAIEAERDRFTVPVEQPVTAAGTFDVLQLAWTRATPERSGRSPSPCSRPCTSTWRRRRLSMSSCSPRSAHGSRIGARPALVPQMGCRRDAVDGEVGTHPVSQLRLFLAALEATGAHEPSSSRRPCPAELEHTAMQVLRDLVPDGSANDGSGSRRGVDERERRDPG